MTDNRQVIAIVDDDPRLLESLKELLESAGYETSSFGSAAAFLAGGLSGIDLLITDIGMPGMGGFELREMVRSKSPALPVFLITGRHEIADQVRARGTGELFCKPFDAKVLLAAIANALHDKLKEDGDDA